MTIHLEIKNLNKTYPSLQGKRETPLSIFGTNFAGLINPRKQKHSNIVVDDMSFTVNAGEIVGLIGANGAGKTTVLKCVSNVTSFDKGEIKKYVPTLSIINLTFGFDENDTVNKCVDNTLALLGLEPATSQKKETILEWSKLKKHINKKVQDLSSGMKARLALGVIFFSGARCLLFDEVLAVGDASLKKQVASEIKKFVASGGSVVLVSHDLEFIRENCSKVVVMNFGKCTYYGNVHDGIENYLISCGIFNFDDRFSENRISSGPISIGFVGPINQNFEYTEMFESGRFFAIGLELKFEETLQLQVNYDLYSGKHVISSCRGNPFCIVSKGPSTYKLLQEIATQDLCSGNYFVRISVFFKSTSGDIPSPPLKVTTRVFKILSNTDHDEFLEINGWPHPSGFVKINQNLRFAR